MKQFILMLVVLLAVPVMAQAHCEMPCGIYDDSARYNMLEENIVTMEKAMNQITDLSKQADKNYNQIVRWVMTKENTADDFMEVVTQYFMTQRLKPIAEDMGQGYSDYITQLRYLHEMLIYAMKCKQTTDLQNIEMLRDLVGKSRDLYFKK
jgi:nickel superoxide dismutase